MKKDIPKKIRKMCKKLKIKLTKRSRSGKRVPKSLKQLRKEIKKKSNFIQKANEQSVKKGTVGAFRKWCKSKKLSDTSGKVTMRCITRGLKDKNFLVRKRANYARNIGGYARSKRKLTSIGIKRNAFGAVDRNRFEQFAAMDFNVPNDKFTKHSLKKVRRNCEDGESGILFNKIIPGMYVNLGNKKCMSVQEVLQMHDQNSFLKDSSGNLINPYTRQPLTTKQILKINDR